MSTRYVPVPTLSQRHGLAVYRNTHSGESLGKSSGPTPTWKRRKQLPWGLCLLIAIVLSWATLGGIVYGLMLAADEIRHFVG